MQKGHVESEVSDRLALRDQRKGKDVCRREGDVQGGGGNVQGGGGEGICRGGGGGGGRGCAGG